jgi:hypothetical protein
VWSQGERRREKEKERDRCLGEFILQANIDLGQDLASLRDSGKESRIVWLPFGQSKLEGLLSSHPRWRKGKQGGRARERERERERESGSVTQMGSQGWVSLAWVAIQQEMSQLVSQASLC